MCHALGVLGVMTFAAVTAQTSVAIAPFAIHGAHCPRVADPKLDDARIGLGLALRPPGGFATVTMTLLQQGVVLGRIWQGRIACNAIPFEYAWDGRLAIAPSTQRKWVDTGSYEVQFEAVQDGTQAYSMQRRPLQIVRLGITEVAALPNGANTEWQMVYFKRGTIAGTNFYATPVLREYLNVADAGQVGDLDRNDGLPRASVAIHTGTSSPLLEGTAYEDDAYNYPLCYLGGVQPRFEVRFGGNGTTMGGLPMGAKYPIPGVMLRARLTSSLGPWTTNHVAIAPGVPVVFQGPPLPNRFARTDAVLQWSFECSTDGGANWQAVPGHVRTQHRFVTVLGVPRFGGATSTQYSGPWVEVVDHALQWQQAIGTDPATAAGLTEAVVKGFGGQVPGVPLPIEDVRYDTNILGGDGGASHYYDGSHSVALSRLLDNHQNGLFVNCSDCASSTAAMLGMLGVQGVQMNRLGSMSLRAIRGIGAPNYTLALWGSTFSHGFSYHHVVTRTAGTTICDACLWVDEDGNPNALPGTPGHNVDRPWSGSATSYQSLLAWAPISATLEPLPLLQ
ncbi:MAG: hypothetical protein JNK15_16865 [Planctomycetes bacterium]|nr:hypothetical protein [Planctomycetota bacterium]